MKTTDLVAWIGAIIGVRSLIWNIYTKVTANRPKLVVRAYANMVQMQSTPKNPRFLRITVQNNGTAPTTLTNVGFFKMLTGWKRLLYRPTCKIIGPPLFEDCTILPSSCGWMSFGAALEDSPASFFDFDGPLWAKIEALTRAETKVTNTAFRLTVRRKSALGMLNGSM